MESIYASGRIGERQRPWPALTFVSELEWSSRREEWRRETKENGEGEAMHSVLRYMGEGFERNCEKPPEFVVEVTRGGGRAWARAGDVGHGRERNRGRLAEPVGKADGH